MATNTILGLGVGLFNAALGKNYLSELANAEGSGMSLLQIADVLDGIPQFTIDVMGGKSADQQVDQFLSHYGITTGAAHTTAKTFVNNMLSSGKGFGAITVAANDYLLGSGVAADFQPAATLLKNKIAVASAFSKTYSSESVATLQGVLAGVTADMDTADEINAYLTSIGFTPGVLLTEGTDIVTGNSFIAPRGFTPGGTDQVNTLNDDDRLTGTSATNDRLEFDFVNDADTGDNNIVPTMNGIEIADVQFSLDGTAVLDLQDSSGFTTVNLHRIDDGATAVIDNITQASTNNLSINNSNAPDADVLFTYLDSALVGTTDSVTLALNNAQVGDVVVQESADDGSLNQGFEEVKLVSNKAGNHMQSLAAEDAQSLIISGDKSLSIFGTADITSVVGTNTLVEGTQTIGGLLRMAGSLSKIDASALKGDLSINLNDVLQATKDGTSGTDIAVSVIGGEGKDTFWLGNGIGSNDTINGGTGDNVAILTGGSIDGDILKTGLLKVYTNTTDDVVIDTSKLPDLKEIVVRNQGNTGDPLYRADAKFVDVMLNQVTKEVAEKGIGIEHGTTDNNDIDALDLSVDLATDGTDDAVVYSIEEGVNRDPRFNFTLSSEDFERVTINDNDSESNSIEMGGTLPSKVLTIKDGALFADRNKDDARSDFINLDLDTDGANIDGGFLFGDFKDGGLVNQGLYGIVTDGSEFDLQNADTTALIDNSINSTTTAKANSVVYDVEDKSTQVRQVAAEIDASAASANVIVRVSTNTNSTEGAQKITMGKGNDTVIFDHLTDKQAGLTISDTVTGGDGTDTLVIDGHDSIISISASEWTNVKGFEVLRVVGNNTTAVASTLIGDNSYNLVLSNDFIDNNGGDMLEIINDNDGSNDLAAKVGSNKGVETSGSATEFGVTIDARTLSAQNHFKYNGEEGGWVDLDADNKYDAGEEVVGGTDDKFILADENVNGKNIIDGGADDNTDKTWTGNDDVLEVRNAATVTVGDLANSRNIGIIAGTNDTSVAQKLTLTLNDTVIDTLVDSYHTSSSTETEKLFVRMNDVNDLPTPAAAAVLDLNVSTLTNKSELEVTLDAALPAFDSSRDKIQLSSSATKVVINNFETAADGANVVNADAGAGSVALTSDQIILSKSQFDLDLSVANGIIVAGDFLSVAGPVNAVTDVSVEEIIFDQSNGSIYHNVDGAVAGGLVLIATLNGVADLVAGDIQIIA